MIILDVYPIAFLDCWTIFADAPTTISQGRKMMVDHRSIDTYEDALPAWKKQHHGKGRREVVRGTGVGWQKPFLSFLNLVYTTICPDLGLSCIMPEI